MPIETSNTSTVYDVEYRTSPIYRLQLQLSNDAIFERVIALFMYINHHNKTFYLKFVL